MLPTLSPLAALQSALADGSLTPAAIADDCAAKANGNASRNTYIDFDPEALARRAESLPPGPLHGVPISLKDLFDLAGTRTTAAARFYAELNPTAAADSALATRIQQTGALITGKTNLHPLAYGVTGENPDFGNCLQPRDPTLLTGGSSSGAAASIQEGSALVAIGTDTGGSVRIPAALCGLVGYRASLSITSLFPQLWQGGLHLAQSFDTIGLLLRDPRDLAPIAQALFSIPPGAPSQPVSSFEVGARDPRIGCVPASFFPNAEPEVLEAYATWKLELQRNGAILADFDPVGWSSSTDIYAAIQASEAAAIHSRHLEKLLPTLDATIAQRLRWGAAFTPADIDSLRSRHSHFRAAIAALFARFDFLVMPSLGLTRLPAGADYSNIRSSILPFTTPFSLAGVPVVTLPGELIGAPFGTGIQLAAPQLEDGALLAYVAGLNL